MSIHVLGIPHQIYMIGDSHSIIYRNLLFRRGASEKLFQCRTRFMPKVAAKVFFDIERGGFNPEVLDALRAEGLLKQDFSPAHIVVDAATTSGSWMERRPILQPAIVFFGGDMDLVALIRQMPGFDFELPDDETYGADRSLRPLALNILLEQLESIFVPMLAGVKRLRQAGFSNLMVHALPPRAADARFWAGPGQGAVRAKLTVLANRVLARLAHEADIPLIDIWQETSQDGFLRPEYDLDGLHLTRAAALISLEKVVTRLYEATWGQTNVQRYQWLLSDRAEKRELEADAAAAWMAHGFVAGGLAPPAGLVFGVEPDSGDAEEPAPVDRLDWVRSQIEERDGRQWANPSQAQLQTIHDLLVDEPVSQLIHTGSTAALSAVGTRLSVTPPGAQVAVLPGFREDLPIRKLLLCLEGEGQITLATPAGLPVQALPVAPGLLVAYEPRRVTCAVEAGSSGLKMLELVLMPKPAGQPFRVIASTEHEWPIDPFQYSTTGMPACPPVPDDYVLVRAI